ncbi:hypothetical protein GALMADRAFT_217949 [Galerina marginata CBS 339.88]|uniref:Uncharacterized protein n=1 Tax=Galerina marginata (strain CBS 339.88) TaxID=685588 RepID=A0A067U0K4_GALM3|nr:hypothetical protein GALMADRAFT_217949 [Galerina marginata CBS 339.88]
MAERIVSRPWSEEEDLLLRQAVAHYGENDNWKTIALSIPGRTNKACRKRWLHSLQPNVKKSAWTPSEDKMLLELYESFGPKWSAIARQIPGRTDDACSKRYREALDPNLKKDQWTQEEDELLVEVYNRIGGKWGQVGQELQRSGLGCRNRWRLLERKKAARSSQDASPSHAIHVQELSAVLDDPSQLPREEPTQVHWPPYYPPEAYPTFPIDEDHRPSHLFRDPTPEALDIPDPKVAPFQFSSSSLSAALSDPPRPPPPLPPVSVFSTPELLIHDIQTDTERQPSLSPLSQCNGIPEMNDILMPLDGCGQLAMDQTQIPYESDTFHSFPLRQPSDPVYYSASPISITSEISRTTLDPLINFSFWKPRMMEYDFDSPRSAFDGSLFNDGHDELSSSSSTPYIFSSSLSPTSSPLPTSLLDLPNAEQPSSSSLLFSPANDVSPGNTRRPRKTTSSRKPKPTIKVPVATRLSSTLPLSTDPNVRPYACGRPQCWPSTEPTSSSCFLTSAELLEHSKEQHPEENAAEKPYRCALLGCGKSWKSINGLQYHLQISTAHFKNALFSRFSAQQPSTPVLNTPSSTDGDLEDSEPERKYACPQPGCYKAYRQPSGLRYHVKYGHPPDMPAQLSVVPPALERQIPTKSKKLRPKPISEPVPS